VDLGTDKEFVILLRANVWFVVVWLAGN